MRVIFMGTPDFAEPSLKALVEAGHDVAAVVTQPDRPRGRGKKKAPPPVKIVARDFKLPVFQPDLIKDKDFIDLLKGFSPDIIVVVAFGRFLPPEILYLPRYGCVNVHASLLPKYRGAAPIHWAVINGEKETGITTMFIDEGMDTGDMILWETIPISWEDTAGAVHDRLALLGARLLLETLELIGEGKSPRIPQKGEPTYAPVLKAKDELISWRRPARDIYNQIRGLYPWPGARTAVDGKLLKVWSSAAVDGDGNERQPGQVVSCCRDGITVATGSGKLVITRLQLQGAKKLDAAEFLRGTPVPVGTIMGS